MKDLPAVGKNGQKSIQRNRKKNYISLLETKKPISPRCKRGGEGSKR